MLHFNVLFGVEKDNSEGIGGPALAICKVPFVRARYRH